VQAAVSIFLDLNSMLMINVLSMNIKIIKCFFVKYIFFMSSDLVECKAIFEMNKTGYFDNNDSKLFVSSCTLHNKSD